MESVIKEIKERIEGIERQVGILPKLWEAKTAKKPKKK